MGPKSLGSSMVSNVRVLEWINYLSGTFHGGSFGHLFRPGRFIDDEDEEGEGRKAVERKARQAITEGLVFIEGRLNEGKWAVGEQMTAVDAFLLIFWRWGSSYGFGMERYPRYRALMEKLVEKEAVKDTLKVEGVEAML
ncbi:hypothetical protein EG329_011702 [Mollisiaceae sp. DMI_Dod_QoI]|nr:hypothetical protein EG329_011702 [Helotiales sp. DMI_Dod_QoI]